MPPRSSLAYLSPGDIGGAKNERLDRQLRRITFPALTWAYHPGTAYEALIGLAIFALIWPLRDRFRVPGMLFAAVVALYSAGPFAIFFLREDSDELALGLVNSQWISLAPIAAALLFGVWATRRARRRAGTAPG